MLRRPGGQRILSVLSSVLFLAGVATFGYPVGTDVYSRIQQGRLEERYASPELQTAYSERRIRVGDGLTTLPIPKPTAVEVTFPVPGEATAQPVERLLTLTTCHPKYSAKQRLIVRAKLTSASPKAAGRPDALRG